MDMVWERKEGGKPATHTHKEERDQRSPSARFEKKEERRRRREEDVATRER